MPATILVVDDHPAVADTVAMLLRADSFTVWVARDGREALAILDTVAVDLVLADVVMPVMDGPALAAELRRRGAGVPVVLMSAVAGPWVPGGNVAGFLLKPFGPDELLDALRSALKMS